MTLPPRLAEIRDDFIENNFKLDDDGFVRSVRTKNFNGNGLLQSISFNDLEFVFDQAITLMLKEVEPLVDTLEKHTKRSYYQWAETPGYTPSEFVNEGKIELANELLAQWHERMSPDIGAKK